MSADTIVPGAGIPQAMNRYGYVFNNPLRFTDPSGHYLCADDPDSELCEPFPHNMLSKDGWAGYSGYLVLTSEEASQNAWWGDDLDVEEAITIYVYQEFTFHITNPASQEAMTRRFWEFCSAGHETTRCFSGFWGYAEAIRNASLYLDKYKKEGVSQYKEWANRILNPSNTTWRDGWRENRPFHWVTLNNNRNDESFDWVQNQRDTRSFYYDPYSREGVDYLFLVLSVNQMAEINEHYDQPPWRSLVDLP